eukprot:SAG31_NODE_4501_length_3183_cov_11.818742_2_plen_54_part_01
MPRLALKSHWRTVVIDLEVPTFPRTQRQALPQRSAPQPSGDANEAGREEPAPRG